MKTGEDFIILESEELSDVEEVVHSSLSNISDFSLNIEPTGPEEKDGQNGGQGNEEEEEEDYNCAASEILSNAVCSTPIKMKERLSVSLLDVSEFTSFPLAAGGHHSGETLQSSRSTVAKSKDSGYNRSGSSLSIASSTEHQLTTTNYDRVESKVKKYIEEIKKVCSHTVQAPELDKKKCSKDEESFRKLKEELEFKDVMISALQESNNNLRMKWADAQNKISELRMMTVQHCTCCPRKTSKKPDTGGWIERKDLINENDDYLSSSGEMAPSETIASFMSSASRIQARRALATASTVREAAETGQIDNWHHLHSQEQEKVAGDYDVNSNINHPIRPASTPSMIQSATSSVHSRLLVPARPNIYLPGDDPLDRVKLWQKSLYSNCNKSEDQRPHKKGNKNKPDVRGACDGGKGDLEGRESSSGGSNHENKTRNGWGTGESDWGGLHFRVFEAHPGGGMSRPQYSMGKLSKPNPTSCLQQAKEELPPLNRTYPSLLSNSLYHQATPTPHHPTSPPTTNHPSRRYLAETNSNSRISSNRNNITLTTSTTIISTENNYSWLKREKGCLYECLSQADQLAEELSTGLAKIPIDLENMRSRTNLGVVRPSFQHRVK